MIKVTLYTKEDCNLCDKILVDLESLSNRFPHQLTIVDINNDPELVESYGFEIPVVEVEDFRLKAPISYEELEQTLQEVYGRENRSNPTHQPAIAAEKKKKVIWTRADDIVYWFSKHYMAVFNVLVLLYVGLPFLAPVFMKTGAEFPARLIYRGYGLLCHQLAYRSFYMFGEQIVYPRASVGAEDLLTFNQATGINEGDSALERLQARDYLGNEGVGYKVALCQRDVAMYVGIFIFGLIYAVSGRRIPGLPWYLWILLGILPIALDGLSQLISQPPLNLLPYRESTPFLRIFTGFIFGFTTAWFGYPLVNDAMNDTSEMMEIKRAKAIE